MMITWTGMPSGRPRPMHWNSGILKICRLPLVKTWAMPRPAMNSTSVATIGWMRKRVTSQPLKQAERRRPRAPAGRRPARCPGRDVLANAGLQEDQRRQRAGDRHERADRQVDAAGGDHQRHADRDDDDGADLGQVDVERLQGQRSCGVKARLKRISSSQRDQRAVARRVKAATRRWPRPARAGPARPMALSVTGRLLRACSVDGPCAMAAAAAASVMRVARQLGDRAAVAQHEDAVGALDHLLEFGRDHQHAEALVGELADQRWISALAPTSMPRVGSSRIRSCGFMRQPARQQHLLLVAAREFADLLVRAGALDAEAA